MIIIHYILIKTHAISSTTHKHFGMVLDTKVHFNSYPINVQNKVYQTIGLLHKLQNTLTRTSWIISFKSFIRPHLDYGDNYDQAYNTSFHQNIKSAHCDTVLGITGEVRGTSREKLSRVRLWISSTNALV